MHLNCRWVLDLKDRVQLIAPDEWEGIELNILLLEPTRLEMYDEDAASLRGAFRWISSPQGADYWVDIYTLFYG